MSERSSATILEFPRPPEDPQARLRRALAALDRAMAEQRQAVAQWRDSLAALKVSVEGLGQSLGLYQSRLVTLAESVTAKPEMPPS